MRPIDAHALWDKAEEMYIHIRGEKYAPVMAVPAHVINNAPTVDAIPIDTVAEMLADLFGDECCCNYNDIDEWLPFVCEHSETCPDTIGKHGCWKQFIKHYDELNKRWHERRDENAAD